jgi:putative spermidine/putrescine transport system permease protein
MIARIVNRAIEFAALIVVLILVLLPVVLVIWMSFFKTEFLAFPPTGYSFKWYANLGTHPEFLSSALLSLKIAAIAMVLSVIVGTAAALGIDRLRGGWNTALQAVALSPMMVPGIVLGTSVFVAYTRLANLSGIILVPTNGLLIAAHVLITVPWTIRLVSSALTQLNPDIEDASLNLGASKLQTVLLVTLPQIRPSMIAAGLFSFVFSLGDIEVSLMLLPMGETTLPIQVANYMNWNADPTIAALSTVQIAVTVIALFIANRFVKLINIVR